MNATASQGPGYYGTDYLLAVEGLTVSFDGFKAVDDLTFYVDKEEIRVIVGPNGAGKTTVLEMKGRRSGNLSGGQQQQLAIARALASRPKVLLLDEPTEGIQPSIIRDMGRILKRIRDERGLSIVVSEQVLSFALDVADRVLVLENGRFVHEAKRADVDEDHVAKYLAV